MKSNIINKSQKNGQVLGVNVNSTSIEEVLKLAGESIKSRHKLFIVTPNPEIVSLAGKDETYKKILNGADIAIPDGVGLIAAERFLTLSAPKNKVLRFFVIAVQGVAIGAGLIAGKRFSIRPELIRGRDLFIELIKLADKKRWKVFLYGGNTSSPATAAENLLKKYKNLEMGCEDAPVLNTAGKTTSENGKKKYKQDLQKIANFAPNILFVGITPPKQEYWIFKNMHKLNKTSIFMAVGGSFDYVAGKVPLPPSWIYTRGFEWFWRLVTQPKRSKRIFTATILFPLRVFWYRLKY